MVKGPREQCHAACVLERSIDLCPGAQIVGRPPVDGGLSAKPSKVHSVFLALGPLGPGEVGSFWSHRKFNTRDASRDCGLGDRVAVDGNAWTDRMRRVQDQTFLVSFGFCFHMV